jgi:hypothetical protein
MKIFSRLQDWLLEPESPTYVGWFRIYVAVFCLWKAWVFRTSVIDLFGQYGFIQWAITRGNMPEWLPHIGNLSLLLEPCGITPDQTVYIVLSVHVLSLFAMLVGILGRTMAIVAWCTDFLLMHASGGLLYGMDYFSHIALFYCVIMPTSRGVSLANTFGWVKCDPLISAGVTRKMLQFQMAIIYVSSGIEKAIGVEWWTGESIWRALTLPIFSNWNVAWLAHLPWIAATVGWSVLIIECGYGIAMYFQRTRALWLTVTVAMHLGIGLLMGMWLFALIMIVLNIGAFGPEFLSDVAKYRQRLLTWKNMKNRRGTINNRIIQRGQDS